MEDQGWLHQVVSSETIFLAGTWRRPPICDVDHGGWKTGSQEQNLEFGGVSMGLGNCWNMPRVASGSFSSHW